MTIRPDIDLNEINEALNNKSDIDLHNVDTLNGADAVIDYKAPTSTDPTWYRLYKSGWVEQGGQISGSSSTYVTVNLPISMLNTNYFVSGHPLEGADTSAASVVAKPLNTRTSNTVQFIGCYQGNFWSGLIVWEVKGMASIN